MSCFEGGGILLRESACPVSVDDMLMVMAGAGGGGGAQSC